MQLFVERAGELLDKDTLLALWPGLVVEENDLSQVVSGLRRALGDEAQGTRQPLHPDRAAPRVAVSRPDYARLLPLIAPLEQLGTPAPVRFGIR